MIMVIVIAILMVIVIIAIIMVIVIIIVIMVITIIAIKVLMITIAMNRTWSVCNSDWERARLGGASKQVSVLKYINKGIGDAGSTADISMLWPWSALVCLGLL